MNRSVGAKIVFEAFQLAGGLDQITPTLSLKPGVARAALNFEVSVTGGYSRVSGYERVDGRLANPSDATFSTFTLTSSTPITIGGAVSNGGGATGTVIAITGNTVIYTQQVGTFAVADVVNAGPVITAVGGALTARQRADYALLAANVYRALITVCPGSGDIRGVAYYAGALYAWRDNAGATLLEMYKATTGGWSKVIFGYEIAFSGGTVAPTLAGTITKGGVTAVVRAVALESGSWGAGTAAGRFITDAPTGGAFTAGAITGGTSGAAANLIAGLAGGLVQALITFLPAGRVQTVQASFGNLQTKKLYGCDNINRGFEFDGTTMIPIRTGMTTDKPTNVLVHNNYLFFSFGPSLQFSGVATPHAWTPLLGAGELVVHDDITALLELPTGTNTSTLAAYTQSGTFILYGTEFGAGGDATLGQYANGAGAFSYTAATMDQIYALAPRGVASMKASLNFGSFDSATLTANIRTFIQTHRGLATAAGVNRERSQYRVFYSNGDALYLTIVNGKYMGAMPVTFPNAVTCWCEGSDEEELEMAFFGSTDGYVRRMDVGPSFDGAMVPFSVTLNFNSMRSPRVRKHFRKAAIEMTSTNQAEFNFGFSLAYADPNVNDQPANAAGTVSFTGAVQYDAGYTYDSGYQYDGRTLGPVEVGLGGDAENISMQILGSTAAYEPFTVNTITVHYTPRRAMR